MNFGSFTTEGIGSISFLESKDSQGRKWRVVVIEEGWSKNERFYSKELLKDSAKLFENARVNAFEMKPEYYDHLPDSARAVPQGFAKNLVGVLENVRYQSLPGNSEGLTADFIVTDSQMRDTFKNAWNAGKKNLLGFSIDVEGEVKAGVAEGRQGQIVTAIEKVNSVDVVSLPAAGGRFLRLVASYTFKGGKNNMNPLEKLIAALRKNPEMLKLGEDVKIEELDDAKIVEMVLAALKGKDKKESVDEATLAEILVQPNIIEKVISFLKDKKVDEAVDMLQSMLTAYAAGKNGKTDDGASKESDDDATAEPKAEPKKDDEPAAEPKKDGEPAKDPEKVAEAIAEKKVKKLRCEMKLERRLNSCKLPELSKKRIAKMFESRIFESAELDQAIADEKDYLAALDKSGEVVGLGESASVTLDESDRRQRAFDLMIGYEPTEEEKSDYAGITPFEGLRQAYESFTGDKQVRGKLSESRIREGATTSDFPYTLGTSMYRKMVREYGRVKPGWKPFVSIERLDNFKTQELIRWGGLNDLAAVAEAAAYTEFTTPSEERATYNAAKKGRIFKITREMILNDDLRQLRKIPVMIARAAQRTLDQFVWDLVTNYTTAGGINGGTVYTGGALYTSGQGNLGSTALGYDAVNTAIDAMMQFTEADSSEVLGIMPKYLVHPIGLRSTVMSLLESKWKPGATNEENNTLYKALEPIIVPGFLRDSNNWFVIADPATCETIEIGFVNGRETPEILLQDGPTNGEVFTNDIITYKVRHEYGGAQADYRGFYGSIVAGS